MIWNSWLIFRLFPNPFEEVSELQIFVNICPNICQYLPIFVLLYDVLYLHLQYTLSLLTSRDLTLPFYGTFVTINILQKNWCFLSKTFVCTGCPKKVTLLLCHYMLSLWSLLSLLSSMRADSARAVTGRQCPHSGEGEETSVHLSFFFYERP